MINIKKNIINKLNLRILALLATIIVFMQLNVFYYVHNEVSSLSKEHAELSERLDKHEEQFVICYGMLFDNGQSIEGVKEIVNDINQKIYEMIESETKLESNNSNKKPNKDTNNNTNNDKNNDTDDGIYDEWYDIYYGRLFVPSVNINVALYRGDKQSITDRVDSANIFTWSYADGYTIADHNNQEFAKLFKVKVGTEGSIELKNGNVINIECVEVFDGHNTGTHIVDTNGVDAANRTDYMMYTCIDNWRNVRICLWEIN